MLRNSLAENPKFHFGESILERDEENAEDFDGIPDEGKVKRIQ